MTSGAWNNFGLHLGEGEADDETVVPMPEAVFRMLPTSAFDFTKDDTDLTLGDRVSAWMLLGRDGPPPRMRIVVRREAIEAAVARVAQRMGDEKKSLTEHVQERLDSYRNNKQRLKRVKALELLVRDNQGYGEVAWLVELFALRKRLHHKQTLTAKEVQNVIYGLVRDGKVPVHITVNGEHVRVPQDVINRQPPPSD